MAASWHFRSVCEEDFYLKFSMTSKFILKQLDYLLSISMHDRNLELKILLNRNTHGSLGGLINTENSRLEHMFPQNFSFQTSTHVSIIQQKQRKKFFILKLHSDPYLVKVVNLSKNKSID